MKRRNKRRLCEDAFSANDLINAFMGAHPKGAASDLTELWRHWSMVMGQELNAFARPLGTRGDVLLIGAEDNLALQELVFFTHDILDRVNAFLEHTRFSSVQLSLLQGRTCLDFASALAEEQAAQNLTSSYRPVSRPAPGPLGKLKIDPESPLGKVYLKYVNRFGVQE